MADNVIELTDATFDQIVHSADVPVLVDFWAAWCGPCKMMAPIVEEIADKYAGRAKVCKVNTDEARDSAMEFGITAIPTTILFKDGQVQKKWVGLTSKKELTAAIDQLLLQEPK
jgi:thioredoxin 1